MKDSDQRPVFQLLAAVLDKQRLLDLPDFDTFIQNNPSVFELVKLGCKRLVVDFGLTRREADALISRGNALALYMARAFREHSLRPEGVGASAVQQGVLGLLGGPTYARLFKPDFSALSPVGAIESSYSTTAYTVALREWVRDRLVPISDTNRDLPLAYRRPDVDKQLIDPVAVNRILPSIQIVNSVLEAQIRERLDPGTDLDALLRDTRFHNGLPYDQDWESLLYVTRSVIGTDTLGEIVRRTDTDYPYFKNRGARGLRSDVALRQNSAFGPTRQALLLEAPYFPLNDTQAAKPLRRVDPRTRLVDPDPHQTSMDFYSKNFGRIGLIDVRQLWAFGEATQLSPEGIEALFALSIFAPKRSANAPALGNPDEPCGAYSGAAFIHAEQLPIIHLIRGGPGNNFELHNVGEAPNPQLEHRMDRINRKCRLDRWLGLRSDEVDQLLMAAIHAERREGFTTSVWITDNTIRALGMFQELRTENDCSAEDFAAFIDVMSVYGRSEQLSHFDRVYNQHSLYLQPLQINDVEFAIIPRTEADERTVHQICSGLGINFETYRYLATVIAKAFGLKTHLSCNLATFSSFYRLVRLARLLGVTPIEATALLQTLGNGDGWVAQLAGAPRVATYLSGESTDVLSVIRALMICIKWCRDYDIGVLWLVQNVNPVVVPTVWTEAQERLLRQLHNQVKPVVFVEAMLLEEGVRKLAEEGRWLTLLVSLVDKDGLVIGDYEETEAGYLERAKAQIKEAVQTDIVPGEGETVEDVAAERERTEATILSVLLRVRAEQHVVVQEGLAVFLDLRAELVLLVVHWAQGHAYQLLQQAMTVVQGGQRKTREDPDPADPFLRMLAELERRSRIATRLALSPEMLGTLLVDDQYQWFSLASTYEISVRTIYFLALYGRMITLAKQPEAKMLDYLRQVNQLPDDLSEDDLRLVRDAAADKLATYFGCGIRHVLECASEANPPDPDSEAPVKPLLCNLAHLDLLVRTLELSARGLDATTGFILGKLTPKDTVQVYTVAAQIALESLSKSGVLKTAQASGEMGQSVSTRCTVDTNTLIANLAQEVAEFEITLLDFFGEPLRFVRILWQTTLGYLLDAITTTDHLGRAQARLQAGSRMGTAHVSFNLLMREPSYAPSVVIGCDEASLNFPSELLSELPKEPVLAGHLDEVVVSAVLMDAYGNRGAGRMIEWAITSGRLRPSETFTDHNGATTVRITSLSAGETVVSVMYPENESSTEFNGKITFVDRPRIFGSPYAITQSVQGQVLEVQCKLVGLDGLPPQEPQTVNWWTDKDATKHPIESNAEGLCTFELSGMTAGALKVFAQRGSDSPVSVDVWVAVDALIQNYSDDFRFPVAGAREPSLLWVDIKESATPESAAVIHYPIEWMVESVLPQVGFPTTQIIPTDLQGRSSFGFKQSKAGEYRVIAKMVGKENQTQQFNLTVIPAFGWSVKLITLPSGPEQIILPGTGQFELYRGEEYQLKIAPVDVESLKDTTGALGWSADYTIQALGMEFTPPLAQQFTFGDQPQTWAIKAGDRKNATFQLGLICDRLNEALILEGTLKKRPLPKRPLPKRPRPA